MAKATALAAARRNSMQLKIALDFDLSVPDIPRFTNILHEDRLYSAEDDTSVIKEVCGNNQPLDQLLFCCCKDSDLCFL